MFYTVTIPAKQTAVKTVSNAKFFAVKKLDDLVEAKINDFNEEIEEGDSFTLDEFNQVVLKNHNDRAIDVVFWANLKYKYSNSKVSMNSSINVMSQSAKKASHGQFNVDSSITRIADINTGRKVLTVCNDSEDKILVVKAGSAIDLKAKGIRIRPLSNMDFKTSEPVFAVSEDLTVIDVRTYQESY